MNVDFLHNQIIRNTVSDKFIESFNENLVPRLLSEYGSALTEIQFYEDHLTSGFRIGGEFYYPLTLVVSDRVFTRWVKWQVANYRHYDKFNPYTYKGRELLEFELCESVPSELISKIEGKECYAGEGSLPFILSAQSDDKAFLAGKYSQQFIDTLAKKLTEKIESVIGISGLAGSGVLIEMRFAPGTFMEHVVENTTYRRLLIKARACNARDLWIKWTRLDGNGIYTISDDVLPADIEIDLAEDVPGKIKEKEYRYLTAESVEKYQAAMGRKNITEWREMMRRVIRRGEVIKFEPAFDEQALANEALEELMAIANASANEAEKEPAPVSVSPRDDKRDEDISRTLESLLASLPEDNENELDEEINDDLASLLKTAIGLEQEKEEKAQAKETEEVEAVEAEPEEPKLESKPSVKAIHYEPAVVITRASEKAEKPSEPIPAEDEKASANAVSLEEKLRYELEEKIRRELEEELKKKNEEAESLRAKLEAQLKAEARERELMAEAALAAIAEQRKLMEERREAEELLKEEKERRAAERKAAEEEARKREAREAEEARIKALEAEKARREAEERANTEKALMGEVKYISKTAKLFFKNNVDREITKRIHEIIVATIRFFHKEDVYIKLRATVPDSTTVCLEFQKIPENELPLLVNIIKVLGKSELGILKATLD